MEKAKGGIPSAHRPPPVHPRIQHRASIARRHSITRSPGGHIVPDTSDARVVVDHRNPPFCFQTLTSLAAIRSTFNGARRTTAIAIYTSLTESANEYGGQPARSGGFKAARRQLAELAGISVDTLDKYLRDFETAGIIEVIREIHPVHGHVPNVYVLVEPEAKNEGGLAAREGHAPSRTRGTSIKSKELIQVQEENHPPISPPSDRPKTVDRKGVTDNEYELAHEVLAAFNAAAGTRYGSKDWITKIILRIREHPDVGLDQHRAVIAHALANPWWSGTANPSVIYGNAAQFERSVHALSDPSQDRRQRGITAEDAQTFGRKWGPGTAYATPWEAEAATRAAADADVVDEYDVRELYGGQD